MDHWHLEHCIRHGEDVDEAYKHVKGRVTHAHFSMSPHVEREMELLHDEGFTGFFSLEVMPPDEATSDERMASEVSAWKEAKAKLV